MDRLSREGPGRLGRRWGWLVTAAALFLLPRAAGAAPEGRPVDALAAVKALDKPVTYAETKIPLGELVAKVAADTGVTLTAARDVADEPVAVVVKAMPARKLLEQVAELLDYQWHVQAVRHSGGAHRDEQDEQDGSGPGTERHPVHPGDPVHPVNSARTPERPAACEIYQDLASKQREEALRAAGLAEAVRQFQEEVKTYEEIAALSPEQFQQLDEAAKAYWPEWWKLAPEQQAARLQEPGTREEQQRYSAVGPLRAPIPRALATLLGPLSSAQWARLLAGDAVTWSSDPKEGEPRLPLDVERRLRDATPSWLAPGAHLGYPQPGDEERMRQQDQALQEAWTAASGYRVTIRLDARQLQTQGALMLNVNALPFRNGAPLGAELPPGPFSGTSLTIFSGGRSALPPPEEDTLERRTALESDPILGAKRAFKTAVKPQPNPDGPMAPVRWSLWDLLPDLARTYQVDFIADSYWSSIPRLGVGQLPREPTALYALLARAAGPTHHWDRAPTKEGERKLIRLRSRTWFLDRPREIPLRYVRHWKALVAERGALPLDTYLEMVTTLTDAQIDSLMQLVEIAGMPADLSGATWCRDMLRLYASLLPAQQETLQHGGIVPLARMTPPQQSLLMATLKRQPRIIPPEEITPEQLPRVGLTLKRVPMIRTIDRRNGGAEVSDQPAAAAPPGPEPAAAPPGVERVPVTQLQFLLTHGQEQRGGVAIVVAPAP